MFALRKALFTATIHETYSVRGNFRAILYQFLISEPRVYTHFCTRIRGL